MNNQLNEHQRMAVEALECLQEICDRHHFTLYLLAGTTLGAVRHKGMIPWDDDIDIGLTYKEWIELKKILPKELDRRFEYVDYDVREGFPRLLGKILYDRVNCVDVFLIAKWTMDPVKGFIHWQIRRLASEMYKLSLGYRTPAKPGQSLATRARASVMRVVRMVPYYLTKPFMKQRDYIRLAQWNERYFETHPSDCYVNLYSIYKMPKERIRKEWIETTSKVEFEGKEYTTVGDTDAYLTHLYGDYMTPPPEKLRQATHRERL